MTVQQVSRIPLDHYVDGIEESIEVTLYDERCAEIRHDEITREHHVLIRQVHKHRIVCLATLYRDQLDARSADLQIGPAVDRHVGLVAAHVVEVEALAEELFGEDSRPVQFPRN